MKNFIGGDLRQQIYLINKYNKSDPIVFTILTIKMMRNWLRKNEKKISRASIVIIFLALIRMLSEVFRMRYYSLIPLTYDQIKPFILGALVSAIALLLMTLSSFWSKHKIITIIAILVIILLLAIKKIYVL
jgi:hypothetical protein